MQYKYNGKHISASIKGDIITLNIECKKNCYEYKGTKKEVLNQLKEVFSSDTISKVSYILGKIKGPE